MTSRFCGVHHRDRVIQTIRDVSPFPGRMKRHARRVTSHRDLRHFLPAVRVDDDHRVSGFARHVELPAAADEGPVRSGFL